MLIAVFAGWYMKRESSMEELHIEDPLHMGYRVWRILVRYVAPLAVIIVFLEVTGIIDALNKLFN